MPNFSKRSKNNLKSCHADIQAILVSAIELVDFTVLCGHRGQVEQDRLLREHKTQLKYPLSKHNKAPSVAVDIAPYPIDWRDKKRFYYLAGIIHSIAEQLYSSGTIEHKIRWGGDWNQNQNFNDQSFFDLPHFELVEV